MNWSTLITASVSSIGGTGAMLLIAIFIGKKWIGIRIEESVKHEYAKKLEEHKTKLQEQINRTIGEIKLEFQDAIDKKSADKSLYAKFIETLPSSGSIDFIDKFNMAGCPFKKKELEQLEKFCCEWNDPEHQFLDHELESLRNNLHEVVVEYLNFLVVNTWCCEGDVDLISVPAEWEETQPERFEKTVSNLHDLAQKIVDAHRLLICSAKRKLKC